MHAPVSAADEREGRVVLADAERGLAGGDDVETVDELEEELALYLLYSDTERRRHGLGGKAPVQAL